MRVIDKLAEMTDANDVEDALDDIIRLEGLHNSGAFQVTGRIAQRLLAEATPDHKIAVRLFTNKGGVGKSVYTYLVHGDEEKPHPGSVVLVPARAGNGRMWGLVQPDEAMSEAGQLMSTSQLKYIVKWVHRYEV